MRQSGVRRTLRLSHALVQLHVLNRDREVAAEQLDRRLVFFVKAIRHFAFEAQHADQLAAHEERDAELALGVGQSRQGNPQSRTARRMARASLCIASA